MSVAIGMIAAESDSISYRPQIHGTLRPRYEWSTTEGTSRVQLRNARVKLSGFVAPKVDYFLQVDLCDKGNMMLLDFWGRVALTKEIKVQAGQFRMPMGIDPFRAPNNYIFANRSTVGKEMCNYRAMGAKVAWTPTNTPLTIEGGLFSPSRITDQSRWRTGVAFAARAVYKINGIEASTGFLTTEPDSVRMNILDAALGWERGRWLVSGEYMCKLYGGGNYHPAHAYTVQADYRMPMKKKWLSEVSVQTRLDGITDHSSGKWDANHNLTTTHPAHNRLTLGATMTYRHSKNIGVDFRLNYENYFYHKGVEVGADGNNKLVAEFVVNF